jgi:chromatin modification-related protein VID21
MRTDFREERKWKLTMAFQLAHAAKKWHTFADRASRVAAGICISHVPPTTGDGDGRADASPARTVMEEMPDARDEREAEELLAYGGEDGSDADPDGDGEDDDSPDPEELGDADRQGSREQQNGSAEPSFSAGDRMLEPSMKMEDLDDRTVLIQTGEGEGMILEKYVDPPDVEMKDEDSSANGGNARSVGQPPVVGLKPESNDPIVGSGLAMDNNSEASKPHNKAPHPALLPVREKLSFSDPSLLFVPEEDIDIVRGIAQLNMREGGTEATTLTTLFPDLSFYGLLDAVPPKTVTDAKKKSGRKEDKDDPYRRPDDVHYSRLMPMNQFMYTKPTLLSTLHPVEHWGDDNMWHNLNNMPINIDIETPSVKPPDESLCSTYACSLLRKGD